MKVVEKSITEIYPYENNPRNNEAAIEPVKKSIQEFGFKVPIVIGADNKIVCGHTRYEAAKQIGMETIPCVIADDLTEEQKKAFRLVDNKTAEFSGWDFNLLREELDEIADIDMADFGFFDGSEITSFSAEDIDSFFTDTEKKEKEPKRIQCPNCGEWIEI